MPKPWKTTTTESSLPGSGTATFGWPFLFWRVRRTHDGGFALHPRRGISRQTNGADQRAQFCANPRFRPAPKRSNVKTFRPPLRPRFAGVGDGAGDHRRCTCAVVRNMCLSAQSAYFKCFLFRERIDFVVCGARARRFNGRCRARTAVGRAASGMARM